MKNHEIDLKLLDEIMNKESKFYKSRKKVKGKRCFKRKATSVSLTQKFAPLLPQFQDIYYQKYWMDFGKRRFARAVGEYLTNICEYKLVYRPNKNTVFKNHPFIKPPKNDDPVLYLDEPAPDLSDDKPEVSYEISGKIGIFDINLKVKKLN